MSIMIMPHEMASHIARQVRAKRLALNLSQKTLAERSGVSYSVIKKFESTGNISLLSLLKLAMVLGALEDFIDICKLKSAEEFNSIDELLKDNTRQRGRE